MAPIAETVMTLAQPRQLHININILNAGFIASAWRQPGLAPDAFADVAHYIRIAKEAERGKLDAIFLSDTLGIADRIEYRPIQSLDPAILLSFIAAATSRIGLIGTASTSYNTPWDVARRFLSLDRASGGRAAWNIVTSAGTVQSENFNLAEEADPVERYRRATEFTEVVQKLWDSWEDGAIVGDKATGRLVDPARIHRPEHQGRYFSVKGALTVPRSPQGQPVRVQAGASDHGLDFAATVAEAVFTVAATAEDARAYVQRLTPLLEAKGRRRGDVVVLPGLAYILGGTEDEARRRQKDLLDAIPDAYFMPRLADILQIPVDRLDPDKPLPDDLVEPAKGASKSFFHATIGLARRENLTVRELNRRLGGGLGHRLFVGTPEQLAEDMAAWQAEGIADGFNLMPDVLPDGVTTFVDEVVPLLQARGIFRRDYEGTTLREHLGLARPDFAAPVPVPVF